MEIAGFIISLVAVIIAGISIYMQYRLKLPRIHLYHVNPDKRITLEICNPNNFTLCMKIHKIEFIQNRVRKIHDFYPYDPEFPFPDGTDIITYKIEPMSSITVDYDHEKRAEKESKAWTKRDKIYIHIWVMSEKRCRRKVKVIS